MKKLILSILVSGAIFAPHSVIANDFKAQQETNVATDQGEQTLLQAQEAPPEIPAPNVDFISAEDQLMDYVLDKFGREGWDPNKKRIIAIHAEQWDTDDPAFDPDFASKRALYTTMASMGGRAKIAEFMRTEMSAKDMLDSPSSDVFAQLSEDYHNSQRQLKKQQKQVVKLLKQFNEQEAREIEGAGWNERGKALLDAAIKKLDTTYDVSKLDEKNQKKFAKTKAKYAEAQAKLAEIEKEASVLKGSISNTMSSTVETIASGAVVGATVLATAESWDEENEQYQVATLIAWSPKLKKSAESLLAGKVEKLKPKPGRTVSAWLKKQDLGSLIGPRQLTDENGDRWFIGVYAEDYTGSSSRKRSAKGRAEIYAKKEAAMSVFANLETVKQAKTAAQTRNVDLNTSTTDIAKSFGEQTSQSVENLQLSGGSTIFRKKVKHSITGNDMYLVVFGISATAASDAIEMERANYASAINIEKYQSKRRGEKEGLDSALGEAKNNQAAYQQGKNDSYGAVKESANQNKAKAPKPTQKKVIKAKTSQSSVLNASDIDDDDF